MKSITLILAFAVIGLLSISSCTREHTCECVATDSNGEQTSTKTVITGSKKKAQEECDKKDSDPIFGPKTDCEISSL